MAKHRESRLPDWLIGLMIAVVVVSGGFSVLSLVGAGDDPRFAGQDEAADAASELAFERWDGGEGSVADLGDVPIVVMFWASWCEACLADLAEMQRASEMFESRVVFLGMNTQESDPNAARQMVTEAGFTYEFATDPDGAVYRGLGGLGVPTTVFIDADGDVVEIVPGSFSDLAERVSRLFGL